MTEKMNQQKIFENIEKETFFVERLKFAKYVFFN